MKRKDIELIKAETARLEAMGVVLGMLGLSTFEVKRAGRPRSHGSKAEKQRAYRKRKSEKVRDIKVAQKIGSVSI
jgi:hypothetical protein